MIVNDSDTCLFTLVLLSVTPLIGYTIKCITFSKSIHANLGREAFTDFILWFPVTYEYNRKKVRAQQRKDMEEKQA